MRVQCVKKKEKKLPTSFMHICHAEWKMRLYTIDGRTSVTSLGDTSRWYMSCRAFHFPFSQSAFLFPHYALCVSRSFPGAFRCRRCIIHGRRGKHKFHLFFPRRTRAHFPRRTSTRVSHLRLYYVRMHGSCVFLVASTAFFPSRANRLAIHSR